MPRDWFRVIEEHEAVIRDLRSQAAVLDEIVEAILMGFRNGARLYVFGNGGSAADAQHIAAELLGRFRRDRRALPTIALTTDTSTLTAVANDYAYDRVFSRQLEGLVRSGDLAWGLSTSGNSPNVLAGISAAVERGATAIGFTGATGGQLAAHCRFVFRAPHTQSDRIQEAHQLAYHYICERVEDAI
ncbi:MAG: SIS domain-containing protein [Phycisphaerales bacterium]|nr:SIS domain-containing protein [Phycisphaerales bacterium]